MSTRSLLARRRFLRQFALVAGWVALSAPALARAGSRTNLADSRLAAVLDELLVHTDSAAVIGDAYLRKFEDERSAAVLEDRLLKSLPAGSDIDARALCDRIRQDFATGNVVDLDGWQLSRTETRLCALHACRRSRG